jgi:uncharacterized membrane protein SpoIIM required for sporulation
VNERRFVSERAERWRALESLIDRAHRSGLRRMPGADVRRLGALYRSAATDLAAARTLGCSEDTVRHVNRLCAAAHDLVYASRRSSPARVLVVAATEEFPALVRRTAVWHLAAASICLLAAAAAFVVFREDPDLADRTLGALLRQRAERSAAMPEDARRYLELRGTFAPFLSWGIIANNVTVSLVLFATSATTIVLGCLSLLVNGVMVGGAFAVFADVGVPEVLGTFIAGHGPLELMALWIAGGAGLRVGAAWVLPGRRTRLAAFQESGREALTLLLGTTLMLFAAGLIEGFVSPSTLPAALKVAVGAATGGAFLLWVTASRRWRASDPDYDKGTSNVTTTNPSPFR